MGGVPASQIVTNASTATMDAAVAARYGPVNQVRVVRVLMPEPGAGQVRVRVHAAGVNPADVFATTGSPWPIRIATGLRRPRRPVLGHDVAGVVVAVGPRVTGLSVGDRVFGEGQGTFAEACLASVDRVALVPEVWTFPDAAAVPMAGTTALQLLCRALPDATDRRLLVIGAGGGVGTFLVQLAVDAGADVVAVCSRGKHELVRSLGASEAVDYTTDDITGHAGRYDAIVDNVADHTFRELLPLLRAGGVLVTNSGTGHSNGGALGRPLQAAMLGTFARKPVRAVVCSTRKADLERLARLGAEGSLHPVIGSTYPFTSTAEALREVAEGHAVGKVVVTLDLDDGGAPGQH